MASIILQNCSLALPVYGTGNRSLKQLVMSTATGGRIAAGSRNITVVNALTDVSLTIGAGDRVGLVGHNGAGKTSLLRMLAGVYEPSGGVLQVEGTVTSLIDVTLGMDHEATGYDNILIRGLILGLTRKQIRELTPDIESFSELGQYLSMPVRTYSSGMVLRLAFSIVTCIHPDILLMDEWLSVGDAGFVKKAEDRLKGVVDKASILVMASHNPRVISELCNVVVTLEHGRLVSVERK
ncbi:ABC transporter ATP-binding protein [Frateuria sp. GZRR33]|uniref:ABC transporter ATP-binding protein n=1 Tax=Frateuria sp. GZRR33 TaxID=3351535 RepID=UPI003EDC1E0C